MITMKGFLSVTLILLCCSCANDTENKTRKIKLFYPSGKLKTIITEKNGERANSRASKPINKAYCKKLICITLQASTRKSF